MAQQVVVQHLFAKKCFTGFNARIFIQQQTLLQGGGETTIQKWRGWSKEIILKILKGTRILFCWCGSNSPSLWRTETQFVLNFLVWYSKKYPHTSNGGHWFWFQTMTKHMTITAVIFMWQSSWPWPYISRNCIRDKSSITFMCLANNLTVLHFPLNSAADL